MHHIAGVADCASVPRGRNGSLASKPPAAVDVRIIVSLAQNGTGGFQPLPKKRAPRALFLLLAKVARRGGSYGTLRI